MANGLNRVSLIGNLGADPELRYTPAGVAVANFNIATTEKWKNSEGELQENTEWHRIVAWRKLAEIVGEYLTKGSQVYVEGKLQTRDWEDKDGIKRYTTEIIINQMLMLSGKRQENQVPGSDVAPEGENLPY